MNTILQVNKHKIIYILTFALLMSSIGIEPNIFINFAETLKIRLAENKGIIYFIVAGIRSSAPILTIIIAAILILKKSKKIKYDFTFLVFFTYGLCTIIGFFLNIGMYATVSNFDNSWINNFLVLQSLSFFLLLYAMYLDDLNFNYIIYFLFLSLFIIYSYFTTMALKELFSVSNSFLYTSDYLTNGELWSGAVPRSSGLARIVSLFSIINIILLLNYDLKKRNILILIITFSILYFLMIILQSRTPFYTINFLTCFIFFISIHKKFWKNLNILLLICGVVFIIAKTFPLAKNYISSYNVLRNAIDQCAIEMSPFKISKLNQELIYSKFFENLKLDKIDCEKLKESEVNFIFKLIFISEKSDIKNFDRTKYSSDLDYNVNTLLYDEKTLIKKLSQLKYEFQIINLENIKDFSELLEKRIIQKKLILNYIDEYKDYLLTKRDLQNLIYEFFKLNNREISQIRLNKCPFVDTKLNEILTGRICHNYIALTDVGLQIFGKGARYDRTTLKWGASNTLVYSYLSAGIFGIIFYLHICYLFILFLLAFIKNTLKSKNKYLTIEEILGQSLFFIIIFFLIRSVVEISFGYFGIDQLIFITCLIYYKKFIFNKSTNN